MRSYQDALRSFCAYVSDPVYDWPAECEQRFGTHPVQVVHEWNTAVHVQDNESRPEKRAFTIDELQEFFDYADEQVTRARDSGRKGWLPAFRDAVLFKVAYSYGLRRNETRMLDVTDIGRNPHGPEFGDYGLVHVRYGKAKKGSPPKRRSVATVWAWTAGRPAGVGHRVPAPSGRARVDGAVAVRARGADRAPADQLAVRRLPRRPRPRRRAGFPRAAEKLRHASHRGGQGPAVRPVPVRARAREHDVAVHLRVLGLPDPDGAPGAG